MHRFYALPEQFHEHEVSLNESETRHLRDVLRLHIGYVVNVFDGDGREFNCEVADIQKKASRLRIIEETRPASPESPLYLTLAAAMLKGDKTDLVIQKAVELGVSCIVPLLTKRCDVKLKDAGKRVERWRKIALEASKQCGRAKLMSVEDPIAFEQFLEGFPAKSQELGQLVMFTERSGSSFKKIQNTKKITAVFGPEGGWDDSELEMARSRGVLLVTLGGRILRAETAAISIVSLLQHRFGDLA